MILRMMRLIVVLALTACAGGAEDRSTLDSIPKAAAATVRQHAGGMTITKVDRETEDGQEVFEAVWFVGGVRHEAKVTAAGVLLELEVDVAEGDVPAPVRATAAKALGKGIKYTRLMKGNYEAEIEVGGKEKEIVIAADGTLVTAPKVEDDDGEEDDD